MSCEEISHGVADFHGGHSDGKPRACLELLFVDAPEQPGHGARDYPKRAVRAAQHGLRLTYEWENKSI